MFLGNVFESILADMTVTLPYLLAAVPFVFHHQSCAMECGTAMMVLMNVMTANGSIAMATANKLPFQKFATGKTTVSTRRPATSATVRTRSFAKILGKNVHEFTFLSNFEIISRILRLCESSIIPLQILSTDFTQIVPFCCCGKPYKAHSNSGLQRCMFGRQGRSEGEQGGTMPLCVESLGGRKIPTTSQVLSSVRYICSQKLLVRIWGRPTCFFPRTPSNLGTPLSVDHPPAVMLWFVVRGIVGGHVLHIQTSKNAINAF